MPHLIAVGACYYDTILTVPHYPEEDSKLRATSISRRRGGNCPNTLEVLSQLIPSSSSSSPLSSSSTSSTNVKLSLIAVLPAKLSAGTKLVKDSFSEDVNLESCIFRDDREDAAASWIVKSMQANTRTIVNFNDLSEMALGEFVDRVAPLLGNEERSEEIWVHFEGRIPDVTLDCILYLRNHVPFVKISVEVEKPGREGLERLVAEADVVFYSKSWALGNGYTSAKECLTAQSTLVKKPSLIICTWGDSGATAFDMIDEAMEESPAWLSEDHPVIDTIGAGDTFIAGMLYSLLYHSEDWTLKQKLSFANELAGRKVVQEGFDGLGGKMRDRLQCSA